MDKALKEQGIRMDKADIKRSAEADECVLQKVREINSVREAGVI